MQRLEVSGAVRHIYVIRRLKVNNSWHIEPPLHNIYKVVFSAFVNFTDC
jgi:hypothetical protein